MSGVSLQHGKFLLVIGVISLGSFLPFSHLSRVLTGKCSVSGSLISFLLHLVSVFPNLQIEIEKQKLCRHNSSSILCDSILFTQKEHYSVKKTNPISINCQDGPDLTTQFFFVPRVSLFFLDYYFSKVRDILGPSLFIECHLISVWPSS